MQDELVITRTFNAPRELVFAAFAEPERLAQWWGAKGVITHVARADVRPGGELVYSQTFPNGLVMWGKFVYREIAAPERLVFVSLPVDAEGNSIPNPFIANFPAEILNTISLTEQNGKTTLEMRGSPINATEAERAAFAGMHKNLRGGFDSTFDRLDEYLATATNAATDAGALVISRIFNAPRTLVWQVWTQPEHLMRWWGPQPFTAPIIKSDFRVGGKYLFCMRSPDGQDYWSTGVFQEIAEPERIVATDSFADAAGNAVPASHYGMPGDFPLEMLVTTTFEELGDQTRLTVRQAGMPAGDIRANAELGWGSSLDKFAQVVDELMGR